MSAPPIPPQLRSLVHERALGRCEYCQIDGGDVTLPHEPDHIVAVQHHGQATAENLALACYQCNRFKGTHLASVDPETGQPVLLFHPRREQWAEHFELRGPRIFGLTPAGRATASLLQFNSAERVRLRQRLHRGGRYPSSPD